VIIRLSRTIVFGCFALAACSSNSYNGGLGNGAQPCNPGTAVQDAQPLPNQTGVSTTIGQIIIVANGNANILNTNPSAWIITLQTPTGLINGGTLNAVPFPNGPHPYPSDFYYASNIPTLNFNQTYTVFLGRTDGSCSAISIGSFATQP
jgi:hypothetical protein